MFVKQRMTANPFTVTSATSVPEAQEVMAAAARAENAVSRIQRNECMFITEKGAVFSIREKKLVLGCECY